MKDFYRYWNWPQVFFFSFFSVILIAYFVLSPGWGFMDDFQCGQTAQAFWRGELSLAPTGSPARLPDGSPSRAPTNDGK
jgi:hypothetical protein